METAADFRGRGKDLAFPGRYGGILLNQFGMHTAQGLDPRDSGVTSRRRTSLTSLLRPGLDSGRWHHFIRVHPLWGSRPKFP